VREGENDGGVFIENEGEGGRNMTFTRTICEKWTRNDGRSITTRIGAAVVVPAPGVTAVKVEVAAA